MNIDGPINSAGEDNPGIADDAVTPEHVIEVALAMFAQNGFNDTRLEQIAKASGMSKRMIHYHFGDKQGLYHLALGQAIALLRPEAEEMELDSTVPVEGVRKVVDAIHRQYLAHPEAMRIIVQENLHRHADFAELPPLDDEVSIILHLDKLMMMGQDAGAFRPGISAEDVFTLISALSSYSATHSPVIDHVFRMDLNSPENEERMHLMLVDTVLAFLTSNIPHTGQDSYLILQPPSDSATSPVPGIYDSEI